MRQFSAFLAFITVVLLISMQQRNEACRIIDNKEKVEKYWKLKDLALQSLQRGPVPPSGNGCTNIPGGGGGSCTNQMNFAGHTMPPPPPVYSNHKIPFGVSQSLQRGPVPPPGNGCTNIPGRGGGSCTNQMNFAGHTMPPPPPIYSNHKIRFGVSQSLQRGPVPPPGNGCTNIPGRGGGSCTNQMNFAGHTMPPPPPVYSDHKIPFGVSQSLQRGPVPPSGNGCTNIPGGGGGSCTNQMNFAGHTMPPPSPVYSDHMNRLGVSQSLQRGPVPPSGNGCTYIPGRGGRHCTNQMNFAGHVTPNLLIPDNTIPFDVATDRK